MSRSSLGTMTHDYKRHGTTTLFAPLNVLEGKVIGRCMQRHQEFIRFLNAIEADIPAGKGVHVTRTMVPSMMAYSKSGSGDNSLNRLSNTPFSAHRRKRR